MKVDTRAEREGRMLRAIDGVFFFLGAAAAAVLAVLTVRQIFFGGIRDWWLVLVLWVLLAYLLLPRVQTMLALIYVPDYFIGRTRIYEGLLGDPVNVALLGSGDQVRSSMEAAGWRLADELGFRSGLRIVLSTLTRRPYPGAPVSPLFLFGRMQDFAYEQEVANSPSRRHHVRFWRTPEGWHLPGGASVDWIAAGTYDRGVGLSIFTLQVTHKVAGDTDSERDHVVQTLTSADPHCAVHVIEHFSSGYHSRNGGGDAIETDGNLPVVDLRGTQPTTAFLTKAKATTDPLAPERELVERGVIETLRDTSASNQAKRPITLYLGCALLLVRVVIGVITAVTALGHPGGPAVAVDLVAIVAVAIVYLALGGLTFRGHPSARMLVLAASLAGAVLALLARAHEAPGFTAELWLANLALDIGILFTLSGSDVRDFHLRAVVDRRAR